ncbi:peptidoglycan-binding protein [Ruania albidiflava]|uniref:peptidoglycan-binding protein n=1 Tax=Ruania albidiflava TaxID=366586 RepID=UPI0003B55956|nr:peptidoglycan-binding protein [Ruania albidiflava]
MSARTSPGRLIRRAVAWGLVAALAVGAVLVWIGGPWNGTAPHPAPSGADNVVTVPVERGTLTSQLHLNGTLGYGDPVEIPPAAGVVTALPLPGEVIEVGAPVYESDGSPVILMEGPRPLWRDLSRGVADGPDILQLEQNLARMGFFHREPDTRFDWWTADAVRRWQKESEQPVTGTIAVADIVVADAAPIRVSQVTAALGESDVSPLTYTATRLRAQVKLTEAQARELDAGTPVIVALPDGTEVEETLDAVDPGGQPTGDDGETTPPTATIEFADQDQVTSAGPAAVRVTVQNSEESTETLIVPATALIATARERYAVEVQAAGEIVRVPVEIGLVAEARVQILASGSAVAGAHAEVPSLAEGDEVVITR